MATEGRITNNAEYGVHIALTCKHHPHLRWSTKNIGSIGQRSIFFFGDNEGNHYCKPSGEVIIECECPQSDLVVVNP